MTARPPPKTHTYHHHPPTHPPPHLWVVAVLSVAARRVVPNQELPVSRAARQAGLQLAKLALVCVCVCVCVRACMRVGGWGWEWGGMGDGLMAPPRVGFLGLPRGTRPRAQSYRQPPGKTVAIVRMELIASAGALQGQLLHQNDTQGGAWHCGSSMCHFQHPPPHLPKLRNFWSSACLPCCRRLPCLCSPRGSLVLVCLAWHN